MSQFLGVTFQPYVGQWMGTPPNVTTPQWNSYSQQDIVSMLEVMHLSSPKLAHTVWGIAGTTHPQCLEIGSILTVMLQELLLK